MPTIRNREALRKKLAALPEAVKAGIRPAMEKGAQEIVDLAQHLCPVDTGALKNSIDWQYGPPPAGAGLVGTAKSEPDRKAAYFYISIWAGNDRAYYARWVEFGTQASVKGQRLARHSHGKTVGTRKALRTHPGTPAQPFFFPAYRVYRNKAHSAITRAVNKNLVQLAQGIAA